MSKVFINIIICGAGGKIAELFSQQIKHDFRSAKLIGIDCIESTSHIKYDEFLLCNLMNNESLEKIENYLRSADLILLALPAFVAIEMLAFLADKNITNAIIVETLSVKSKFYEHLNVYKNSYSPEVIGLNPLFRPDIGFLNNNVLYLTQNPSQKTESFLLMLKNTGAKLRKVSVDEHEGKMAIVQAGTHAMALIYGMLLKKYNYNLDECLVFCTPVQRHFLQLLARILAGEPHVYEEIQMENKHSKQVREDIISLSSNFNELITQEINFHTLFSDLHKTLGKQQPLLAQECQRAISLLNDNKEYKNDATR